MPEDRIRTTKWRALIEVEFETRDYGVSEEGAAQRTADRAAAGAGRAERDVSVPRPHRARVFGVRRVEQDARRG